MMMIKGLIQIVAGFIFFVLSGACSLEVPHESDLRTITIKIPQTSTQDFFDEHLQLLNLRRSVGIYALPSTLAGFNCFAANVRGTGIGEHTECGGNVILGATSDFVPPGAPMSVQIPAGPSRIIEIFGQYNSASCMQSGSSGSGGGGDSMSVARVASKIVDIVDDGVINIVSGYSGSAPEIYCPMTGGGTLTFTTLTSQSFNFGSVYTTLSTPDATFAAMPGFSELRVDGSGVPYLPSSAAVLNSASPTIAGNFHSSGASFNISQKFAVHSYFNLKNLLSAQTSIPGTSDYYIAGGFYDAASAPKGYVCGLAVYGNAGKPTVYMSVYRIVNATTLTLVGEADTGFSKSALTDSPSEFVCELVGRTGGAAPKFNLAWNSPCTVSANTCYATITPSAADLSASPLASGNEFGMVTVVNKVGGGAAAVANRLYIQNFSYKATSY